MTYIRQAANILLVVAQISLDSGEWIEGEDQARLAAAELDEVLGNCSPAHVIEDRHAKLAEIVGDAVLTGKWFPGDWAMEWQGWYIGDVFEGEIVHLTPGQPLRLAA